MSGFLQVGEDGMVHEFRHVCGDLYRDCGLYEHNGHLLALNQVTNEIDEVVANRFFDQFEKVCEFEPDGRTVGMHEGTRVLDEVEQDFFGRWVKKGGLVV